MRIPMPSPRGTNFAGQFITAPGNPAGAYDAAGGLRHPRRFSRGARDESVSGEHFSAALRDAIEQLKPEDEEIVMDLLREVVDSGDIAEWAADRRRGYGRAKDEPSPFSGRPRPGGEMDPIERAQDRRYYAMDSRRRGFERRFPSAARIGHV